MGILSGRQHGRFERVKAYVLFLGVKGMDPSCILCSATSKCRGYVLEQWMAKPKELKSHFGFGSP